jgi:hypothetical protein
MLVEVGDLDGKAGGMMVELDGRAGGMVAG